MKDNYFRNKPRLIRIVIIIAAFSIGVRLLIAYDFEKSALLYVGIPFLVSLGLIQIRDPGDSPSWKKRYLNRLIDAFIIMLASSVVLFEGFVCVVMFMPLYLFVILVMFLTNLVFQGSKNKGRGSLRIHILPALIALSALEGVNSELSFDRNEQVTVTRVVENSIAGIKQNLVRPIDLQKQRPWFLALFPMPDKIKAESLNPGDVHEIHFTYYRWFFFNKHKGRMLLEISEVEKDRVKTTVLDDSSYIASYLDLKGTEIVLHQIDSKHTRISLTIEFKRTLDPYWYISPIERYGINKAADLLITEVIAREKADG